MELSFIGDEEDSLVESKTRKAGSSVLDMLS